MGVGNDLQLGIVVRVPLVLDAGLGLSRSVLAVLTNKLEDQVVLVFLAGCRNPIDPSMMLLFCGEVVAVRDGRIEFRELNASWALAAVRVRLLILEVALHVVRVQEYHLALPMAHDVQCLSFHSSY